MNNDSEPPAFRLHHQDVASTHGKAPVYSNPFARIVHEVQAAAVPAATDRVEASGRRIDVLFSQEQPLREVIKTPQKRLRPFRPPSENTVPTLLPFVNLLNVSKTLSAPPRPFHSDSFQMPTTPRHSSSSPFARAQEAWEDNCSNSQPADEPILPGTLNEFSQERRDSQRDLAPDDTVFEELKDVYKTLSDQTKQAENLRYQVLSLKTSRSNMARENAKVTKELEETRAKMDEATAKMDSLQLRLTHTEASLTAQTQELSRATEALRKKTEENLMLERRVEEADRQVDDMKVAYAQEIAKGEREVARVSEAGRKVQELLAEQHTLRENVQALRESHSAYCRLTDESMNEIRELKSSCSEAVRKVSPMFDEGSQQALLSAARSLLSELREELADSRRVNDLLRDKLHYTSTQLADATSRLRELEEEKKEIWTNTLRHASQKEELQNKLLSLENKIMALTEKLIAREGEIFDAIARAAELEAKLEQATNLQKEQNIELSSLETMRQKSAQLQAEVTDLTRRLNEETAFQTKLQNRLDDSNNALISTEKESFALKTQLQDVVGSKREVSSELSNLRIAHKELESSLCNAREDSLTREKELQTRYDTQISSLRELVSRRDQEVASILAKHESSEALCDQLRAAISQEQALSASLQQGLKETEVREAMAVAKVDIHEARIAQLTREAELRDETLHQLSSKAESAQERYQAQASTLRLTKEELGNLQERFLSDTASKEASLGALRAELAILRDQNSSLLSAMGNLRQESKTREEASAAELNGLRDAIAARDEEKQMLVLEHALSAQRKASEAEKREEELMTKVAQLQNAVDGLQALQRNREEESLHEQDEIAQLNIQVTKLSREKEGIMERQRNLLARYKCGDLSDVEKDFMDLLTRNTQSFHEQEDIARYNEIKRRDALIISLQERIGVLETSLAYAVQLPNTAPDLSILNLKASRPLKLLELEDSSALNVQLHESQGPPPPSQVPSELSTPPQSPKRPETLKTEGRTSFAGQSNEISIIDSEVADEHLSKTFPPVEATTSKKRLRTTAMRKANHEGGKATEQNSKRRQKRRKDTT